MSRFTIEPPQICAECNTKIVCIKDNAAEDPTVQYAVFHLEPHKQSANIWAPTGDYPGKADLAEWVAALNSDENERRYYRWYSYPYKLL